MFYILYKRCWQQGENSRKRADAGLRAGTLVLIPDAFNALFMSCNSLLWAAQAFKMFGEITLDLFAAAML